MKKLKLKGQNNKTVNLLHICAKLNTLFTSFGLREQFSDYKLTIKIVRLLNLWRTCEGAQGLKRFKDMSNLLTRRLMGFDEPSTLNSTNKRLLFKVVKLSGHSSLSAVYWISVFSCYRLIHLPPVLDTSTITGGFKGSYLKLLINISSFVQANLSFTRFTRGNWTCRWKWHVSGKSGPNGPVAYSQYLNDLYAIRQEWLILKISLLLYSLPVCNKRETFEALKDALFQALSEGPEKASEAIHSRLAFLSDKGGKTRVIAMIDILSQSCLSLVHQRCNNILRIIPEDGTFDQDQQRRRVQSWSNKRLFIASIDLSAATDRIPVIFQLLVLIGSRVLTPLQGLAWLLVTTKRTFVYYDKGTLKQVRYKVGQPMGALSSWPVMAISHHVLVLWASIRVLPTKQGRFCDYCILGDDLVIANKEVSESYLELISYLGIDYSKDKSFSSFGVAEFAKSLFRKGQDLTPFPLGALVFEKNTIVTNLLAVMSYCSVRKHKTTLQTLTGLTPVLWRNLAALAALSPSSPNSVLDTPSRKDYRIFFLILWQQKIRYFSRLTTVRDSTHAFAFSDPGKSGKALSSPYLQTGQDNGNIYPVRRLRDTKLLVDPVPMVGSNWFSYCSIAWPNGIPTVGSRSLVPLPTWKENKDEEVVTSSLLRINKLLPGYFTIRCVGPQVGE